MNEALYFICGLFFGIIAASAAWGIGTYLHNKRSPDGSAENALDRARRTAEDISTAVSDAGDTAKRIGESVSDLAGTVGDLQNLLKEIESQNVDDLR